MLTDEQGQPQSGEDARVDIVYRLGGKTYRALLKNLQDAGDAGAKSAQSPPAARPGLAPSLQPGPVPIPINVPPAPPLPGLQVVTKPPPIADLIQVYTDGACTGNPGPMGIGAVILDPLAAAKGRQELSEYLGIGTNNIAELTAIQRGLLALPRQRPVIVYSDSSYAIGVLAKGWKAKANQELIAAMRQLLGEFSRLYFMKVAGHAGVPENERCDVLARQAILRRSQHP